MSRNVSAFSLLTPTHKSSHKWFFTFTFNVLFFPWMFAELSPKSAYCTNIRTIMTTTVQPMMRKAERTCTSIKCSLKRASRGRCYLLLSNPTLWIFTNFMRRISDDWSPSDQKPSRLEDFIARQEKATRSPTCSASFSHQCRIRIDYSHLNSTLTPNSSLILFSVYFC